MLRSIELGRAILCLPATNLELWLTTSITISLTQDDITTQTLKSAQVLSFLSSGEVWVHRGPGMCLELHVTSREEPVPLTQSQDLIKVLLRAPIWEQLMLHPSPPTDINLINGIIHLNINYANSSGTRQEQQHHRISSNVPPADVRPPEGIPTIAFHSVHFSLQFLDPRPRQKTTRKRTKAATEEKEMHQADHRLLGAYDSEESDDLLHEVAYPDVNDPPEFPIYPLITQSNEKKRKRARSKMTLPSTLALSKQEISLDRTIEPSSDLQTKTIPAVALSDHKAIESLVDGAIRFSIYGSFTGKSACGIKVKANTFHLGLADVAPALWRPGYLNALSQRAHLLAIVSQSINQVALVKATSMSLKHKARVLKMQPAIHSALSPLNEASVTEPSTSQSAPSIACHLWRHLQKNLTSQSAASLRTLPTYDDHENSPSELEEMLPEVLDPEASL